MKKKYFVFIDESGVLDESKEVQPFFAVGFLKLLSVGEITEKLSQRHYDYFSVQKGERRKLFSDLKQNPRVLTDRDLNLLLRSTRHHEYKFTSINFTNLERYKSFINTSFLFSLYFCALVINKTDPFFDSKIYKNYWHAYIEYSKLLCRKNCLNNEEICVIADYMNKPSDSEIFFEKEINLLPNVFNTLRAHSETFTLLQLCDLMLGSVIFQWREKNGFMQDSNRAKAKKEFVDFMVNKLTIPDGKDKTFPLAQSITIHDPFYLSVWPLKLNKKSGGV